MTGNVYNLVNSGENAGNKMTFGDSTHTTNYNQENTARGLPN